MIFSVKRTTMKQFHSMRFTQSSLMCSALASLIFAVWIYLTKRPSNLLLNVKFDQIFGPEFRWLLGRSEIETSWPDWIVCSLPAALWLYATNTSIILYFPSPQNRIRLSLYLILFCLLTELLQLFGVIPGTFDKIDSIWYIVLGIIPILCHEQKIKKFLS